MTYPVHPPPLRQQIIASAIQAALDRLNIAPVSQPPLDEMAGAEIEILVASLRRLIDQRRAAEAEKRLQP